MTAPPATVTRPALPPLLVALATAPERGMVLALGRSLHALEREVLRPVADHVRVSYTRGRAAELLGCKVHLVEARDPRVESRIRGLYVDLVYVTDLDFLPPGLLLRLHHFRLLRPGGRMVLCQRDRDLEEWKR